MRFEHNNIKPEYMKEEWENKFKIFSWLEFVCAIPHPIFMVTTIKENGLPNAALQGWSSFTGEGDNYFIIMSGIMKHTHTYQNIKREKEFCINFVTSDYLDNCWKTIEGNDGDIDEITSAGFTSDNSHSIKVPGIKESFLRLECEYQWEKELCEDSFNITICGKVKHVSVDEKFAKTLTEERYGHDSFMFNLHNPMNPFNGENFGSGIGHVNFSKKI